MAVIRYRVEATVTRTYSSDDNVMGSTWQYEVCHTPAAQDRLITREEALRIIREEGLILVHQTPYGSIYDTPDEPLWEKHNGYYGRDKRRR